MRMGYHSLHGIENRIGIGLRVQGNVTCLAMCEDAIISWALKIFSNEPVEAILLFNASCDPMGYFFSPAIGCLFGSCSGFSALATIFSCSTGVGFFETFFFSTSGLPALVT